MKAGVFPVWGYLAVALAIACIAFAMGQVVEGLGVPFVLLATTLWAALSSKRQREWFKKNG